MTSTAELADLLGGSRILGRVFDSPLDWVEALHHGFPIASVAAAIAAGVLTESEADQYVIQPRTRSHRGQKHQRLTVQESDLLARIARLTARAAETFGDRAAAHAWLREPSGGLGGARPLELLKSGEGAILVEQILTRIDHGVHT